MTPARRAMLVTGPLTLAVAYAALRDVRIVQARNADAIVATFAAQSAQVIALPAAGTYQVFGAGSRDALKGAERWDIAAQHRASGVAATIGRADARRAKGRDNKAALDMLFTITVATPGEYSLRLTSSDSTPGPVNLRISRFSSANAGAAMRAFGLAALFSALLVVNAVLWFRGPASLD